SPTCILNRFGLPPLNPELKLTPHNFAVRYQTLAESAGFEWDTPLGCLLATTYLIIKRWLPRLLHNGDIHTMAFSVEARVPFADTEVIELSEKVHPDLA